MDVKRLFSWNGYVIHIVSTNPSKTGLRKPINQHYPVFTDGGFDKAIDIAKAYAHTEYKGRKIKVASTRCLLEDARSPLVDRDSLTARLS